MIKRLLLTAVIVFALQTFFYSATLRPFYFISKGVVPLIAAIIAFTGFCIYLYRDRYDIRGLLLISAVVVLTVQSALMANHVFGQKVWIGLLAQAKLVPLFYYFLVGAFLSSLRFNDRDILTAITTLAVATAGIGVGLLLLSKSGVLDPSSGPGSILRRGPLRGYRVLLPTVAIELLSLYSLRRALKTRKFKHALIVILGLSYIALVAKTRVTFVGLALVMAGITLKEGTLGQRLSGAAAVAVGVIYSFGRDMFTEEALLGAFSVRMASAESAVSILAEGWENILFGVGYLNRVFGKSLQQVIGEGFWPSDLGWLGVVFEYGLVGTLVFLVIYVTVLREAYWKQVLQPVTARNIKLAIGDYTVKILLVSPLSPSLPMYAGVVASLLAILVYINEQAVYKYNSTVISIKSDLLCK